MSNGRKFLFMHDIPFSGFKAAPIAPMYIKDETELGLCVCLQHRCLWPWRIVGDSSVQLQRDVTSHIKIKRHFSNECVTCSTVQHFQLSRKGFERTYFVAVYVTQVNSYVLSAFIFKNSSVYLEIR